MERKDQKMANCPTLNTGNAFTQNKKRELNNFLYFNLSLLPEVIF